MKGKTILRSLMLIASLIILLCMSLSSPPIVPSEGSSLFSMMKNRTYMYKPVYPARINASQIPVGDSWTFIYRLSKGSVYHVYFIGDWIGSKTDYDVYVYDPKGNLRSIHTESAGLPERLGNTLDDPFFTPEMTGDYYFAIFNDPRESSGEDAATLMVIEHLECNRWYERYIRGKVNFADVYETAWAYEFVSDSERIEVWIEVPETLDMYEVRLYFMANPSRGIGDLLNGCPTAWEPGLYGEVESSGYYGGYNLEDDGFKHPEALASCGVFGQDMLINYTSPFKGETVLYHLVLIGENGKGTIRFMIKTDFKSPSINLLTNVSEVQAGRKAEIKAEVSDDDLLRSVLLYYTDDDWVSFHTVNMTEDSSGVYLGTIPASNEGREIEYKVVAVDMAGNTAEASGCYSVKDETQVTLNLSKTNLYVGEKIIVTGQMSHGEDTVTLKFTSDEKTIFETVQVDEDGFFKYEYKPDIVGRWIVKAIYNGNEAYFEATSEEKSFTVMKIPTSLDLTLSSNVIKIGEKVDISGSISPAIENKPVEIRFTMPNGSIIKKVIHTSAAGKFNLEFSPSTAGKWSLQAAFGGDEFYLPSTSSSEELIVNSTWMLMLFAFLSQFLIYIATAIGGTASALVFFLYWRRRSEY